VIRPKHRHSPQGTQRVIALRDNEEIEEAAGKLVSGLEALPNDPDLHTMMDAMEDRNDVEVKRLLPLMKARYADRWAEIGRACMDSMGRKHWKKRRQSKKGVGS
jgi:hypothetical protein